MNSQSVGIPVLQGREDVKEAHALDRQDKALPLASALPKDQAAWRAVIQCDVPALDAALARGADPNAVHPTFGHSLLEQACRSQQKGSAMAAMLIERGSNLPKPEEPLAFELCWRAIADDSVLLAKQIISPPALLSMDFTEVAAGRGLLDYFMEEKSKYVTASPTALDCMLQALAAKAAVDEFVSRHPSPLATSSGQSRLSRSAGMR